MHLRYHTNAPPAPNASTAHTLHFSHWNTRCGWGLGLGQGGYPVTATHAAVKAQYLRHTHLGLQSRHTTLIHPHTPACAHAPAVPHEHPSSSKRQHHKSSDKTSHQSRTGSGDGRRGSGWRRRGGGPWNGRKHVALVLWEWDMHVCLRGLLWYGPGCSFRYGGTKGLQSSAPPKK